jgi:hypothetical protein
MELSEQGATQIYKTTNMFRIRNRRLHISGKKAGVYQAKKDLEYA